MPRKSGAAAVQESAIGHNSASDDLIRESITYIAKKMSAIAALRGDIKVKKSELKDAGVSKIATGRALKQLRATEEQRQCESEVQEQTDRITELCADLPLFGGDMED